MSDHKPVETAPKTDWLEHPKNVKKLIVAVFVICAGLFVADALYHKHPHFAAEEWFGFYAIYSFAVCVGIVLVARLMQMILRRDEEYYDKNE